MCHVTHLTGHNHVVEGRADGKRTSVILHGARYAWRVVGNYGPFEIRRRRSSSSSSKRVVGGGIGGKQDGG